MISSSSLLSSGLHRGSRDQLAGGNLPHVVSASSDIFPAATASGVLADAGLTGFVPVRLLVPFCISDLRCCPMLQCTLHFAASNTVDLLVCRPLHQRQSHRCNSQRLLLFRRPLSIASMYLPTSRVLVRSTRFSKSWSSSHSCWQIHFNWMYYQERSLHSRQPCAFASEVWQLVACPSFVHLSVAEALLWCGTLGRGSRCRHRVSACRTGIVQCCWLCFSHAGLSQC